MGRDSLDTYHRLTLALGPGSSRWPRWFSKDTRAILPRTPRVECAVMKENRLHDEMPNPYMPVGVEEDGNRKAGNYVGEDNQAGFNWVLASLFGYVLSFVFAVGWTNPFVVLGSFLVLGLLVAAWFAASLLHRIVYGRDETHGQ